MTKTETHTNKTLLRVLLAAAAVLILCGTAASAVAGAEDEANYQVGEATYSTLSDAFTAAHDGDTIVVLKDVTEKTQVAIYDDKRVILDLNGQTISAGEGVFEHGIIKWCSSKTLIITDTSSEKEGKLDGKNKVRVLYIYSSDGGVEMQAGTITGGSAELGGGVYVGNGAFTMSGSASITGNRAFSSYGQECNGGGVYVGNGAFNVCDSPVIKDNMKETGEGATANNVYLSSAKVITITQILSSGAEIWINSPASTSADVFATGAAVAVDPSKMYFHPDSGFAAARLNESDSLVWDQNPKLIEYSGKAFYGSAGPDEKDPLPTIIGGGGSPFNNVNASYSAEGGKNTLQLKTSVSLTETLEIVAPLSHDRPFTLDLNGQILQADTAVETVAPFSIITVSECAELALEDSQQDASHTPAVTYMNPVTDESVTVTGGVITGGTGTTSGLLGTCGGGLYVDSGGKVTMSGGTIVDNTVTAMGGGVYLEGNLILTGSAAICGNISGIFEGEEQNGGSGGGVYVNPSNTVPPTLVMKENAKICGNTSSIGGGICLDLVSSSGRLSFIMSGGLISNNYSKKCVAGEVEMGGVAGGVAVLGSEESMSEPLVKLTGGSITGNLADTDSLPIYSTPLPLSCGLGALVVPVTVSGTISIEDNKLTDDTDSNTSVFVIDIGESRISTLSLVGNLTGKIHISGVINAAYQPQPMTEGDSFGTTTLSAGSGEENFIADVAAGSPALVGSIKEGKLVWKAGKSPKPSPSGGDSPSQGSSVWLTADIPAEPKVTPTPTPGVNPVETPSVKPIEGSSDAPAKTPAPFLGILAGLGCAAVLFGLRRK